MQNELKYIYNIRFATAFNLKDSYGIINFQAGVIVEL
jgi:hypothetical protein